MQTEIGFSKNFAQMENKPEILLLISTNWPCLEFFSLLHVKFLAPDHAGKHDVTPNIFGETSRTIEEE